MIFQCARPTKATPLPSLSTSLQGSGQGCPQPRASDEHSFIVRVLRATRVPGRSLLIPSWAKDPKIGHQCINAKAKTVADKPSFRASFKARRCLVIATGFYEWQVQGPAKQPMWIGLKSHRPFAFAGLWEQWQPPEGTAIESYAILTTEPNELLQPIHNRMPVILAPSAYDQWLDPTLQDTAPLKSLLRSYPNDELLACQVSTLVNNPRHDAPDCLEPRL